MKNLVHKFFQEKCRKNIIKKWRSLALAYRNVGESDHWIRARITEYINTDYYIILKQGQTKDDYIEDILRVLYESETMSG